MRKIKRKLNFRGKLVTFLLFLILGIIFGYFLYQSFGSNIELDDIEDEVVEKSRNDNKKIDKVSLVMVGDNLIHDKIYNEAKRENGYDFKSVYSLIKPIVSKYDLAYYNQETILGGSDIGVSSYPSFNSPYEVGDAMIDAGFNLVSLATNHTLDRGEKAILNSRSYWNSKNDVLAVGSYSSFDEKNEVQIRKIGDISYTLLNYTYGTNGIDVPLGKEYLVNIWPVNGSNPNNDSKYQSYKEEVKKDIEKVKDKVDLVMVAMHWGIEYEYNPNEYQKDMAKYLASLGVNIIIGTHPHVVQPIEWIDNTLVIYSLGNFVSAHEVVNIGNRVGLMSSVDIIKEDGKIKIDNLSNDLLYMYYTNSYKEFLVVPFSQMDSKYLSNYKEVYDKFKNIVQNIDSNIKVVDTK